MTGRHALVALAALALGSAPVLAQGVHAPGQPAAAGESHQMGATAMICTMGMLPHPGMGAMGGMMGGQGMGGMMGQGAAGGVQQGAAAGGMQHGAAAGGMQHGAAAGGMQHGAAAGGVQQGAAAGGMQHGAAAGGMQHGAATGQAASGQGMGGMEHPVTPTMLIHHAEDLALTAEQQGRVTELARTSQASCEQHLQAAATSHHAAAALLNQDSPDISAYEAKLREAVDHLLQAHVTVIKAGAEARAVLTPAQREKLSAGIKEHAK
jgi:hypothetical protein